MTPAQLDALRSVAYRRLPQGESPMTADPGPAAGFGDLAALARRSR